MLNRHEKMKIYTGETSLDQHRNPSVLASCSILLESVALCQLMAGDRSSSENGNQKFWQKRTIDDLFHSINLQSHYMCSFVFSAREITRMQNQTELSTKIMRGNLRGTIPLI